MSADWIVATGSVRGERHVRRGDPNEDAVGVLRRGGSVAVAVADGHGSARCTRAATGAAYAVDAALEAVTGDTSVGRLAETLVDRWRSRVDADLAKRCPSDREAELSPPPHRLLYGSTALAASATADRLQLLQLGDGDALTGRIGSSTAGRPFLRTEPSVPGQTDSLSQIDAAANTLIRDYDLRRTPVDVVLLATDGLDSAFSEPGWYDETMTDLRRRLAEMTPDELPAAVERWCAAPAATGGDDTSIALLIHVSVLPGGGG